MLVCFVYRSRIAKKRFLEAGLLLANSEIEDFLLADGTIFVLEASWGQAVLVDFVLSEFVDSGIVSEDFYVIFFSKSATLPQRLFGRK